MDRRRITINKYYGSMDRGARKLRQTMDKFVKEKGISNNVVKVNTSIKEKKDGNVDEK